MNWALSKNSVNSGNSHEDDPEPRQRSTREGVETGHGATYKTCSLCNISKPLSEFYKKDKSTRLEARCKACVITKQRKRNLGITDEEYWDIYWKQDGKCGICHRRIYSKRYKRFCVDHDHATGEIRGLLCHNCNGALGMLKDCPAALKRAVEWVEGTVRSSQQ